MKTSAKTILSAGVIAVCSSPLSSSFVIPAPRGTASSLAGREASLSNQTGGLTHSAVKRSAVGVLSAEKPGEKIEGEEDQEPMDLDLEAMFEVFEAADKEVSDEEVGKKGGKKTSDKDAGSVVGDMLSSFFGGGKK